MHIYLDESGSFVPAKNDDSWCVVVAYMTPDSELRKLRTVLAKVKRNAGKKHKEELKLKDLTEKEYFTFLRRLAELKGRMFAIATNMSLLTEENIVSHQSEQADRIVFHIDKIKHETGREGLQQLSKKVRSISPQLYMQLVCQVMLLHDVVNRGILYFVQRTPKFLRRFKWRIDQKNTTKTIFEDAFEAVTPSLLQTISLEEPGVFCEDFDYGAMDRYMYDSESAPTYLRDTYGVEVSDAPKVNIGKLFRDDLGFADSAKQAGIQVADFLASGLRRVLKNEFANNEEARILLGRLMVTNLRGKSSIQIISFVDAVVENKETAKAINVFDRVATPILLPDR